MSERQGGVEEPAQPVDVLTSVVDRLTSALARPVLTAEERATLDRVQRAEHPLGQAVRDIADLLDIIDRLASRPAQPMDREQAYALVEAEVRATSRQFVYLPQAAQRWQHYPGDVNTACRDTLRELVDALRKPATVDDGMPPDGKEAEELRAGIERLVRDHWQSSVPARVLQDFLDSIDARDSLAYLERKPDPAPAVDPVRAVLAAMRASKTADIVAWAMRVEAALARSRS